MEDLLELVLDIVGDIAEALFQNRKKGGKKAKTPKEPGEKKSKRDNTERIPWDPEL